MDTGSEKPAITIESGTQLAPDMETEKEYCIENNINITNLII